LIAVHTASAFGGGGAVGNAKTENEMKQVTLGKKDKKKLNEEIKKSWNLDEFFDDDCLAAAVDDSYILKAGEIAFFYDEGGRLLPALKLLIKQNFLKKIIINMGAVPFIAKGADLMRPGIVGVDVGVKQGEIVVIMDERNMRPIAVGETLFSKEEMEGLEAGKMVLNLHHVGDDVWNFAP
jgi:PUA-domain protein